MLIHSGGGGRSSSRLLRLKGVGYPKTLISVGVLTALLIVGWLGLQFPQTRLAYKTAWNYLNSYLATYDTIEIDLKYADLQRLSFLRDQALKQGLLTDDLKENVHAVFHWNNLDIPATVRLKGQWLDHVLSEKWSLKVSLKGQDRILGMEDFTLQHPKTRGFIHEWVYHEALKSVGLFSPRYRFVRVKINGEDRGVYAMEEGLGDCALEALGAEGKVLLQFDASLYYRPTRNPSGRLAMHLETGIGAETSSRIEPLNATKTLSRPETKGDYQAAEKLLEGFRRRRYNAKKVFDLQKWAKYFAISELLGSTDAAKDWKDLKFYYNPRTRLLEPVGTEGGYSQLSGLMGAQRKIGKSADLNFHNLLFSDRQFFETYVHALEEFSDEKHLKSLIEAIRPELGENLKRLHREYPTENYSFQAIQTNATLIHDALNPPKAIRMFQPTPNRDGLLFMVSNLQFLPVELLLFSRNETQMPLGEQSIILQAKDPAMAPQYEKIAVTLPNPWRNLLDSWIIHYRILGSETIRTEEALAWPGTTLFEERS